MSESTKALTPDQIAALRAQLSTWDPWEDSCRFAVDALPSLLDAAEECARLRAALRRFSVVREDGRCFCQGRPHGDPDHSARCDAARAALAGKDGGS